MTRFLFQRLNKNLFLFPVILLGGQFAVAQQSTFAWPEGKRVAISLSFDDARESQATTGIPFLNKYGVKGTFYVVPSTMKKQLEGWKVAVASGQEIGNHSLNHPCTGNFTWSRSKALEDYTLERMQTELAEANELITSLLGVTPTSFAYPCGMSFVGRGEETKSYVPVVARQFQTGRGWLDEAPNSPEFCDFAQLTGMQMDGKDFGQIMPLIEQATKEGQWLVLAGHEMGEKDGKTTGLAMLEELIRYAQDPKNGVWLAPVGTVAEYVHKTRGKN